MAKADPALPFDAVILAGGAAHRLGGIDKPGTVVHGRTLIGWVAAAAAGAGRLIVVGPARPELPGAVTVREQPVGSGPVPALRAGLAEVRAPWLALLAADLPYLRPPHLSGLLTAAATADAAGAVLADESGRQQWLAGVWRAGTLRAALAAYQGTSLRGLLTPLLPVLVRPGPTGTPPWFDCDTPADLERARTDPPSPDVGSFGDRNAEA